MLGTPELDAVLQGFLRRAEQRGSIPSLDLLATLLVMQPRRRLAFWAARPHCRLMSHLSPSGIPQSFSAGLIKELRSDLGLRSTACGLEMLLQCREKSYKTRVPGDVAMVVLSVVVSSEPIPGICAWE